VGHIRPLLQVLDGGRIEIYDMHVVPRERAGMAAAGKT
jgi:hypothetical protein